MQFALPPLTLNDLAGVGYADLDTFMVENRWRTDLSYAQRRITPRLDKAKVNIKGWRVSHEKGTGAKRDRIQKSFYFGTHEGFEDATSQAHSYRDKLETEQGLVAWRLRPVESLENAFCVAGITLQTESGRRPYWLYRQGNKRITCSIAQHGFRGAYLEVAKAVAPVSSSAPLPLLNADEAAALISSGLLTQQQLDVEAMATKMWVRNYLLDIRNKNRRAAA
ncbi:hypothetical protein [Pseudomonas amygdali]|uniref:Uncharacterized protein n=2 Tax=Pseudomonas amygdali pv. lachrymans TaxID=53707 RepID=A0ABR5KS11_PSEAV|nr:hypothetical protein [Pseudomonas amygdali]AXH60004.1 hypothetical protein PLA107_032785 [Pseudomonas amygdali pv. lachrymans str. M301315]KPC17408.1 Uncharacterized protein AC499_0610 [Pseudomonas amygdali pv. lachrymans]RMT06290.1 hypothetical protein ALP54_03859 [Pseudomonas amygdali pv. lachrymans]